MIDPRQRPRWRDFGDEMVFFDSVAGSTHLLNATAAEAVLFLAAQGKGTTDEIWEGVRSRLALSEDELPRSEIENLLEHLSHLAIVASIPSV